MYLLNLANHCVIVENWQYFDTTDCGGKSLYGYWAVSDVETNDNVFYKEN